MNPSKVPYNENYDEYLDLLIRNEENETEKEKSYDKIERLKQLKLTYQENIKVLKKDADGVVTIAPEKILDLKDTLIKLKHYGPNLSDMLGNVSNTF